MTRNSRIALLAAAAVVAVVAIVIIGTGGGDDDKDSTTAQTTQATTTAAPTTTTTAPPPKPPVPVVSTRDGAPVGEVRTIEVDEGERLRFRVTSNIDEEVHVHGFDVTRQVSASKPAVFNLKTEFTGRFEVEFHGSGEQIATVGINP